MRKIENGDCFFTLRSSWQKLIVNLVDNDHGWNGIVVRVFGPWKAVSKIDRGLIPLSWNMEPIFQVVESASEKVMARALKLYQISYDCAIRAGC